MNEGLNSRENVAYLEKYKELLLLEVYMHDRVVKNYRKMKVKDFRIKRNTICGETQRNVIFQIIFMYIFIYIFS